MEHVLFPLLGGALIGASVSLMLFLNGRVTGVSGILNGALCKPRPENLWRLTFIAGLLAGGCVLKIVSPEALQTDLDRSLPLVIVGGVLVGFGTVMGGGCTSGHGICGISRLSIRSIIATLVFMAFGVMSATFFRTYMGGQP